MRAARSGLRPGRLRLGSGGLGLGDLLRHVQQAAEHVVLNPANARALIMAVVIIGVLLIGMIVVNAQSAKLQYDINQLRSQNDLLENEIGTLNVMLIVKNTSRSFNTMMFRCNC